MFMSEKLLRLRGICVAFAWCLRGAASWGLLRRIPKDHLMVSFVMEQLGLFQDRIESIHIASEMKRVELNRN